MESSHLKFAQEIIFAHHTELTPEQQKSLDYQKCKSYQLNEDADEDVAEIVKKIFPKRVLAGVSGQVEIVQFFIGSQGKQASIDSLLFLLKRGLGQCLYVHQDSVALITLKDIYYLWTKRLLKFKSS